MEVGYGSRETKGATEKRRALWMDCKLQIHGRGTWKRDGKAKLGCVNELEGGSSEDVRYGLL